MGCGRIAAGRQQWRVGLAIVIGTNGQQARQRIVCHERYLQSSVSTTCGTGSCGDVTSDGSLFTQREVKAHIQVMIDTRLWSTAGTRLGVLCILLVASLCFFDLSIATGTKDIEVADFIGKTYDQVVGTTLIDLDTRHGKVEDTCTTILHLRCQIIIESDIDTNQRSKRLVDAHCRNAKPMLRSDTSLGGVTTYGIDTLVGVVEGDTLEMVAEPWEFRESCISEGPVGQQTSECRKKLRPPPLLV